MAKRGVFDFDTLTPSLQSLLPRIDAGVDLAFDAAEASSQSAMRANAPWHDNTGNARAGLNTVHEKEPMVEHTLILYHSVSYGVWLEVRFSGRYAIIGPTMFQTAQELSINIANAIHRSTRGQA